MELCFFAFICQPFECVVDLLDRSADCCLIVVDLLCGILCRFLYVGGVSFPHGADLCLQSIQSIVGLHLIFEKWLITFYSSFDYVDNRICQANWDIVPLFWSFREERMLAEELLSRPLNDDMVCILHRYLRGWTWWSTSMSLLKFAENALSHLILGSLVGIEFFAFFSNAVLCFLKHAVIVWILKVSTLLIMMSFNIRTWFGTQLLHLLQTWEAPCFRGVGSVRLLIWITTNDDRCRHNFLLYAFYLFISPDILDLLIFRPSMSSTLLGFLLYLFRLCLLLQLHVFKSCIQLIFILLFHFINRYKIC